MLKASPSTHFSPLHGREFFMFFICYQLILPSLRSPAKTPFGYNHTVFGLLVDPGIFVINYLIGDFHTPVSRQAVHKPGSRI